MFDFEKLVAAAACLVDNGIDQDEVYTVLQALGYIVFEAELEDVITEEQLMAELEVQNKKRCLLDDAKKVFYRYIGYVEPSMMSLTSAVKDKYGVNPFLACNKNSPQYLLETIVEKFNTSESAETSMENAVEDTLNELHDRVVNGNIPFVRDMENWKGMPLPPDTILFELGIASDAEVNCDSKNGFIDIPLTTQTTNHYLRWMPLDMDCVAEEDTVNLMFREKVDTKEISLYLVYQSDRETELLPFNMAVSNIDELRTAFNDKFTKRFHCTPEDYWNANTVKP